MKKNNAMLALAIFLSSTAWAQAPAECDSIYFSEDTYYIFQGTDTQVNDTMYYTGHSDMSYTPLYFDFPDSTYIDINDVAYTSGVIGAYDYVNPFGYSIIYNHPSIPPNTVVHAFRVANRFSLPAPCSYPVTFIINATPTSIQTNAPGVDAITIYPHPAAGTVHVNWGSRQVDEWVLYNALGEKVKTQKTEAIRELILPCEGLPAGVYFLQLLQAGRSLGEKKLVLSNDND